MRVHDPIFIGAVRVADLQSCREVLTDGREVWRVAGTDAAGRPFNGYHFDLDGPVSVAEILQVCKLAEVG